MTTERKFKFTETSIKDLAFSEKGKRCSYRDSELKGFELRVTDRAKVFYVCRWLDSNTVRVRLGAFPDMKVKVARKRANEAIAKISDGVNPNEEKRALRAELTLGELFEDCLTYDFKPYLKSWKEYDSTYNRYLKRWANRPLSKITRQKVQALHGEIGRKHGHYSANRTVALLSSLFSKAIARGYEGQNPATRIKKFREKSRERFLEADELPRFFQALAEEENETLRDFVLMALLTGARRSNVLSMKWENVFLDRGYWEIPETKNGNSQRVVLVPTAIEILERRKSGGSEFVFPGEGKAGHFNDPKRGWARILERAEIPNLRIHDLRRSLGSWQAATGASLSMIGKSLNHKNVNSTAIYARLNLDPVRASVEAATTAILKAGGVAPQAEVIDISDVRRAS